MAFQQGLSGLYAASKALDVTSNNVANSATVGFKSATAHFADVYANALSGSGSSQVGIGTSVGAVQQQFTTGNITTTNNPLDIAINGSGFFRMDDNGAVTYSRSGQFHLDKNGFIIDDQLRNLTGYPVVAGTVVQSAPTPLQLSAANQSPVATGQSVGGSFQGVKASLNLDSRSAVKTSAFDIGNPASYNFSTATEIFDSLGNSHSLTMYARKTTVASAAADTAAAAAATTAAAAMPATTPAEIAAKAAATAAAAFDTAAAAKATTDAAAAATAGDSLWMMYTSIDGTSPSNVTAGNPMAITFDTSGHPTNAPTGGSPIRIDLDAVTAELGTTNSATPLLEFKMDFADSTQFGDASGANSIDQDGYTSGRLTGVSVGGDGVIRGNYSNGQSRDLGQVVLANFTNPNGLTSLGGNQWAETAASGTALVGAPNTGTLGVLQSGAIEESNVDLTGELVNMITQQRNYQANAQSIKTQDQIMQTLVNLR